MEDGAIVNLGDPAFAAQFILPIDTMGPLPHNQDLQNPLGHVVVRPFLMDMLAGVEEYFLGRSISDNAAGEPQNGCWL